MDQQESRTLGDRLRALRQAGFPGVRVTQKSLADALGVVMSSVSAWESGKIPPPNRLDAYATLFATPRSIGDAGMRVLPPGELTPEERAAREALLREFSDLAPIGRPRAAPPGEHAPLPSRIWNFGARVRTRIVCGAIDPAQRPACSRDNSPNYVQLSSYADLDSLVELFGHVRAANPLADVRFELAKRLESDDMRDNFVALGSTVMNNTTRYFTDLLNLPVRQIEVDDVADGKIFQLADDPARTFPPRFAVEEVGGEQRKRLIHDVGMFFRTRSPFNVDRTLTICSGVFTRGVYGAVRLFTDKKLREQNEAEVRRRFGDATTFGMLVRVPVLEHATPTPDLRNDGAVLYAWNADGPVEWHAGPLSPGSGAAAGKAR